jgi:hypothetical protein
VAHFPEAWRRQSDVISALGAAAKKINLPF